MVKIGRPRVESVCARCGTEYPTALQAHRCCRVRRRPNTICRHCGEWFRTARQAKRHCERRGILHQPGYHWHNSPQGIIERRSKELRADPGVMDAVGALARLLLAE